MANDITEEDLKAALGKHISAFCGNDYAHDKDEHCAHFVSHMLDLRFGATCSTMAKKTVPPGNIRVQEIWPKCQRVGKWADLAFPPIMGLAFIGNAGEFNVKKKTLAAVPRLHIGIFYGQDRTIYHYSNKLKKVIAQTPAEYGKHFAAPDNAMFWGEFPL